jgi:RHS repeat-associated protein
LRNDIDGAAQDSRVTEYAYTTVNAVTGPGHIGRWWQSTTYGGDNPSDDPVVLPFDTSTISVVSRNAFGMATTVRDEEDRDTSYVYDNLDRLTKVTLPNPLHGQLIPVVEYAYELSGLLKEETQTHTTALASERITTHYQFDPNGRIDLLIEDYGSADPAITNYDYDLAGNITQSTDARGEDTWFYYDVLDRPIHIIEDDPDGAQSLKAPVTLLAYDALGRLIATRDPVNQITRREYDALGRVTKIARPLGATTTMAYDAAGQLIRETDPLGRVMAYSYDDAGRLASSWQPGNVVATTYKYDSADNLRKSIDPLGHTTEWAYDERFRVREEKDANGDSTLYDYTNANELNKLTDAELNETTWIYDGAGRVRSETNELGHARAFTYDAYGRLEEKIDRNGRTTRYEYDRLHHLATEKWYLFGGDPLRTITYDFDKVGNLENVSDPTATYVFQYDELGRETNITANISGFSHTIELDQDFDAADNRTKLAAEIGGADDFLNDYTYDALNRLVRVRQQQGIGGGYEVAPKRVEFSYFADGQFKSISRYANLAATQLVAQSDYAYDAAARLAGLVHKKGGTTFANYGFTYDAANRLQGFTNSIHSAESATYTYDYRDQLTDADRTGTSNDETYVYDDNGNRNNAGFTPGVNNRLMSDGVYNYAYDNEGRITTRTKISDGSYTVYGWDHRHRLVAVIDYNSSGVITQQVGYYYDAFNRLVKRSFQAGQSPTTTTYFVYDGNQMVLELDQNGDPVHRLLWGPAVDQALADETSAGDVHWYLTDHLGTVRDVATYNQATDTTTIANHIAFDSFGRRTSETNSALGDFDVGFTGKWFDRATGLQWNLNRWYNAAIQRWLSEDPIGFAGGDANLYRYVGNSPTTKTDPNGLFPNDAWTSKAGIPGVYPNITDEAMQHGVGSPENQRLLLAAANNRPGYPPKDMPKGTRPINQHPDTKDKAEEIKGGLKEDGVGASSWVGIAPNDDVIVTNDDGTAENLGPWTDYVNSVADPQPAPKPWWWFMTNPIIVAPHVQPEPHHFLILVPLLTPIPGDEAAAVPVFAF